jgi:hypothetical protein
MSCSVPRTRNSTTTLHHEELKVNEDGKSTKFIKAFITSLVKIQCLKINAFPNSKFRAIRPLHIFATSYPTTLIN